MSETDVPLVESFISTDLNAVIVLIFLTGMYTVIYFGTIYIYFTKYSSKHYLVSAAITMLYLSGIVQTAIQWYSVKWGFVDNGDTRQSVFLALVGSPSWILIAINTSNCTSFAIADGLLIWRCFHIWNRSLSIISLPLFLVIAEIALFLVQISFNARYTNLTISQTLASKLNDVLAAAYFTSFGATLITTVLIAYRIYSVSKHQGASSRRFQNIIDIVVQSGVIYALSQLTAAISGVIPGLNPFTPGKIAFIEYGSILNFAIAGISSTVMVARVALLSPDTTYPSASVHLSGLQFYARSTHPTVDVEAINVTDSFVDGDRVFGADDQAAKDKVQ